MGREKGRSVAVAVVKGAVAGAVGTWVMDRVTWFILNREDEETKKREEQARPGGEGSATILASRAAKAVGRPLKPEEKENAGMAMHFLLGIMPAALFGAVRHQMKGLGLSRGVLFGASVFLLMDELANWWSGAANAPWDYLWQAHARGLAGHITYGATTDATLELLDRIT